MEALLTVHFALLAVFILTCLVNKDPIKYPDVRLAEWHHGYMGDLITAAGWALGWWPLVLVGLIPRLDDTYQHARQLEHDEPEYESPLHRFYAKYLWPWPPIQWLSRAMDWLASLPSRLL